MTEAHAHAALPPAKPFWWLALIGFALIVAGAVLAKSIRTSGGITVYDIRFVGTNGTKMSALLYVPKTATAKSPAPGILAVHGYINSRETQDGFSIEFARRGYVVLALDQTGHGYSGGAAFSNGFGGPDGLRYLRALPQVDPSQIGLEGHSMGGWTVLAAAAAMPDGYRSIVLEGSSTGAPFAREGTPDWPRNLALVFSRYDEFSSVMWNVNRAADVGTSAKLKAVFGAQRDIGEGEIYGSIVRGTARVLYQPYTTHPGDHLSPTAIGHAVNWFGKTLEGGTPLRGDDQIWYWKEFGTGMGLIGFVMVLLGTFDALLRTSLFHPLAHRGYPAVEQRDRAWWRAFLTGSFIPPLLFFPAFIFVYLLVPPSALFPQVVTTQVTIWALVTAVAALSIERIAKRANHSFRSPWVRSIAIAAVTVAAAYLVLVGVDAAFQTDFRFWIVAVKLPAAHHWPIFAVYVVPITLAFLVTLRALCHDQTVRSDRVISRYGAAILSQTLGFLVIFGAVYAGFFATGTLVTAFDPLSTVIALQFIPVLATTAIIAIFTWERTGSHRPGAVLVGILVTLYVVAGTATQV